MDAFRTNPQPWVRTAGLMYAAIIGLGMFGELAVRGTLLVPGDPQASWDNIQQAQTLWRLGIAGDILMHVLDVPCIVVFYLLLRRVDPVLALVSTGLNFVQTAVLVSNKSTLLVPLMLAFGGSGDAALAEAWTRLHAYGFGIGLVFFGFACVLRGWLIVRCGFLPRTLGVLLAVAGLAYLVNSTMLVLAGGFDVGTAAIVLLPALVGESALALWMLVRGVDLKAWRESAPG